MPRPSVVAVAVAVAVALCSCAAVQSRIVQRDEKAWWDSLTHEQREEILKSAVPVGHEAANAADRGGAPAATKEPNGVDGKVGTPRVSP